MGVTKSIKDNWKGYLVSSIILCLSVVVIHKAKFKTPPLYYDVLITKLTLAPFLLFGLMVMTLLLIGEDKE